MDWSVFLTGLLSMLGLGGSSIASGIMNANSVDSTNALNAQLVRETNQANYDAQMATNATNERLVRETNAANVQQAELAYKRSLPINQVRNMMQAGMSKPAALNALSGGGTYSMPTLQTSTASAPTANAPSMQPKHYDFSQIGAAMERIAGIPSSVMQHQMNKVQLERAEAELDEFKKEAVRKQELHDYQIWREQYGKNTSLKMDAVSNYIAAFAADNDVDLSNLQTVGDFAKAFKLGDNKDWRDMPAIARQQVIQSARDIYAENRSRISAEDTHAISKEQLSTLKAQAQDFEDAKDARKKEYLLRDMRATIEQLASSRDLAIERDSLKDLFAFDDKGNIIVKNGELVTKDEGKRLPQYGRIRKFWRSLAEVVPINVLSQIIRTIIK